MILNDIKLYFDSNCFKPFLAYIDDENYLKVKKDIEISGDIQFLNTSDFCRSCDSKPDLDLLRERLRELDVDVKTSKYVLLGLGEYLSLEGIDRAKKIINEFLTFNLGTAKVCILMRGFKNELFEIINSDIRMTRQVSITCNGINSLNLSLSPLELNMYRVTGLKEILHELENTACDTLCANSSLEFPLSTISITYVKDYYDALVEKYHIDISKDSSNESYWKRLWDDFYKWHSFERIFEYYGFSLFVPDDFYQRISNDKYENWLYFIYLKKNTKSINNSYLSEAVKSSRTVHDLKKNILIMLSSINHLDARFEKLYQERKRLVRYYSQEEMAFFVSNNRLDPDESIYRLTDNTLVEKKEIIAYISQHGIPDNLPTIYADLDLYLKKYNFSSGTYKEEFSEYFDEYKKQKISNTLKDSFLKKVKELAHSKIYNALPSRNELVLEAKGTGNYLCWIDALGAEYISFIVGLAKKKGLSCSVKIGRADLPTLTSINRGFYDNWNENSKRKIDRLDELKHKESGGYRYGPSDLYPVYLAEELEVLKKVVDDAALELALHHCNKYVIASDHGASRLAVIAKKEEPYETDTKGEHSGRCCKSFEGYNNLTYATEDNGYIVLADYGRFKGSRAANVEVHGGASLEEVIVPLIILSLTDSNISFKLVKPKSTIDRKIGLEFSVFANLLGNDDVYVEYNGNKIKGIKMDESHWKFTINEIKRAGNYLMNIYIGESLVSSLEVQAVGKMAIINNDFEDLL